MHVSDVAQEQAAPSVEIGRRAARRAESRMLIDGDLVAAESGAEFDNVSPATGLVLGATAAAGARDMSRAIAAARRAFDESDWSTNRALRKRCLEQLQSAIEAERDDLREELIAEVGCPDMTISHRATRLAAGRIPALPSRTHRRIRMGAGARGRRTVRRPQRPQRGQGTRRRRRRDHAVELPDRGHPQQARTRAGDGQHRRPQTRSAHSVERDPPRPPGRRAHRHPGRRAQRGPDPSQRRRGTAGDRPSRRHDLVHRLDRRWQAAGAPGRRDHEADVPRARRQVGAHRHRRRRPRQAGGRAPSGSACTRGRHARSPPAC